MTALNGVQRARLDDAARHLEAQGLHTKAADLQAALDLIDAQAAVIERLLGGWTEPMTEAEAAIVGAGEGTDGE